MSAFLGLAVGILLGSTPTATWLGRRWALDLRAEGTGNPGANNAYQLGGPLPGATVLLVEAAKGFAAVWLGHRAAGPPGAALAGAGTTLGNVYNPWLRLRGGKGLAISAGTVAAAWPGLVIVLVAVIAGAVAVLRRSGPAALSALAVYASAAVAGLLTDLPGRWLIVAPGWMAVMAAGQVLIMTPKHLADARRVRRRARPGSRGGS